MRFNFLRAFGFGFLFVVLASLVFCFAKISTKGEKKLSHFFQIKIDSDSATPEFFAKLKKKFPEVITSESLTRLIDFENKTNLTAKNFTPSSKYLAWFFDDDGFQNIYVKRNFNPIRYSSLYCFIFANTREFCFEEDFSKSFIFFFLSFILFCYLSFLSEEKFLFSAYSFIFLFTCFLSKSFIVFASTLLIFYSIFFYLYLNKLKTANPKQRLKNNFLLLFIFGLAVLFPIFNFNVNRESTLSFYSAFLFFVLLTFFVKDLKKVYKLEMELKQSRRAFTPFSVFEDRKFFQCERFLEITLMTLVILSLGFIFCTLTNPRLSDERSQLDFVHITKSKIVPSFSTASFFYTENIAMSEPSPLASLNDFVKDAWMNVALNYTRVDEVPVLENGCTIYYNDFVYTDGKITEVENRVLEFNNEFIKKCLSVFFEKSFDANESPYIIMLAENGFLHFVKRKIDIAKSNNLFNFLFYFLSIVLLGIGIFLAEKKQRIKTYKS
ncbi:MAG: hypothetical protein P1P64_00295 [Treponemataceae bacterium]